MKNPAHGGKAGFSGVLRLTNYNQRSCPLSTSNKIVLYVLPRLQEPGTCCGLAAALWAGGVGLFIVCRLQYGIEPSLSRHVGVVSVDTAKPFAAVLPSLSTYSKATKDCDLRHCKYTPFFVPRKSSGRENAGVGRKRDGKATAARLTSPSHPRRIGRRV